MLIAARTAVLLPVTVALIVGCRGESVGAEHASWPTTVPSVTTRPTVDEEVVTFDAPPRLVVCSPGARLLPTTLPWREGRQRPHATLVVEAWQEADALPSEPVGEARFTSPPLLIGTGVDVRPVKEPHHYVVVLLAPKRSPTRMSAADARKLVDWMRITTPKGGTVSIATSGQAFVVKGSDLIDQLDAALALIDLDTRG